MGPLLSVPGSRSSAGPALDALYGLWPALSWRGPSMDVLATASLADKPNNYDSPGLLLRVAASSAGMAAAPSRNAGLPPSSRCSAACLCTRKHARSPSMGLRLTVANSRLCLSPAQAGASCRLGVRGSSTAGVTRGAYSNHSGVQPSSQGATGRGERDQYLLPRRGDGFNRRASARP